jgi:hypothetical protein
MVRKFREEETKRITEIEQKAAVLYIFIETRTATHKLKIQ